MKPSLILNANHAASLSILENTKVTLTTFNRIDDIRQFRPIENVTFSAEEDFIVEFQVPVNLSEVTLTIETSVNVILLLPN